MKRWTIGPLLETSASYLRGKGSTSARLDAELLLAEALGVERIQLYTEFDRPLSGPEVDRYRELVGRRARHEPVAYILGRAHFRHMVLEVTPAVLIPRPETEELVDVALRILRLKPPWEALSTPAGPSQAGPAVHSAAPNSLPPTIADVGTGSGAIAFSVAKEFGLRVLATEASPDALAVAARNRRELGLESEVELWSTDLLSGLPESSLRMVISNPPYVRSGDWGSLAPDIRLFEPALALDAGPDGLGVFRRLLPQAAQALKPGGTVLVEVGEGQASAVVALAHRAGFCLIEMHKDLSQKERIVAGTLPGAAVATWGDLNQTQTQALASALEAGAIIGLPTDTVYGLGARWDSAAGVQRLSGAKGRGIEQPVAVLFSSVDAVKEALPDLDVPSAAVLAGLLPGPYTFVVRTLVPRPPLVGTADSLGVRVPAHPSLLAFLSVLGTPLAATSANFTGRDDAAGLADVDERLLAHCAIAFESNYRALATDSDAPGGSETVPGGSEAVPGGSETVPGCASTVVDLRAIGEGGAPIVLREGAVPAEHALDRISALLSV